MIDWLTGTLVWTGALIALVLLIRRPVMRHLGPQAAYALWLIPFARLFVPVIELPAAFSAQAAPAPAPLVAIDPVILMAMQAEPAPPPDTSWLWIALALGVWLAGAAAMLGWRYLTYFRMRARLLAEADEKLRIGGVRIVETGATDSPLAFGIIDKVIVVPAGFLDEADIRTRNLAIAHEMAHHERGDLLANFAVQPLFALHWFNPLGWLGWRALRCDQEAACDARVVSASDHDTRAAYAHTIARFSAGPDLGLAAPMACPVLGEKSIIQRLRSLAMADISPRRRWAGRAAIVTGLLAMPLTASFTHAAPSMANETPQAQDEQADRGAIVIRETDPDAAARAEEQAEILVAETEAMEARAEAMAEAMAEAGEAIERDMRVVFVRDGKVLTEEAIEKQAKELDRMTVRLKERGAGDVRIRVDLGEAHLVDAERIAELRALGRDMARIEARIVNDPEWQARLARIQATALEMAEIQMPRLLEMQRDLAEKGMFRECRREGETTACASVDVRKIQRQAMAEARREIARDDDLSPAQRKHALEALDKAMSAE